MAAPLPSPGARAGERHLGALAVLALGHLVVDTSQGALPALLPFLRGAFDLSYAAAGVVLLVANVTSSLVQPVFGYLSDRMARRWLLPWSPVVACGGLALTGLAPSYLVLLVLVVAAGLGIAAYHPEGYRTAHQVAGARKATGLSYFSIGGNVGLALGPPMITTLVAAFGLRGTLGMLGPGLLAAGVLAAILPAVEPAAPASEVRPASGSDRPDMWGAMAILIGIVTVRSWTQLGLTAFVPFYYVDVLGADPRVVGPLLFAFLAAGAVGTLVGGRIADRWGIRRYVRYTLVLSTPLVFAFLARGGDWIATALLAATGFVLVSTFSVTVALAQAYLPRRLGMAAGLIVGLAIGTGGVGVALLGLVADRWGVPAALSVTGVLPLIGFALGQLLPEPRP